MGAAGAICEGGVLEDEEGDGGEGGESGECGHGCEGSWGEVSSNEIRVRTESLRKRGWASESKGRKGGISRKDQRDTHNSSTVYYNRSLQLLPAQGLGFPCRHCLSLICPRLF